MPFEKGHKLGKGRPKGVPNKDTKEIREAFQMLIEENLDNMTEWLKRVADKNPAKAMELINGLSDYVIPKLNRTEVKAEISTDEVDLSQLPKETIKKLLNEDRKE